MGAFTAKLTSQRLAVESFELQTSSYSDGLPWSIIEPRRTRTYA